MDNQATEHIAHRPSWDCASCDKPWPCDPAREEFMTQMTRVERAILMWTYLEAAAGDVGDMPVREIFDRFIRWTR